MRLCFVAHMRDLSGANRSLIDLILVLRKKNDITVIVPRKGELKNTLDSYGIKCKVLYSGMWMYSLNENKIKVAIKYLINQVAEIGYYFYFKRNKFDLVHFNSSTYGCGARSLCKLGLKYTWHIRELAEDTFGLKFFNKNKSVRLINNSKKIIAISRYVKDLLDTSFNKEIIEVVYNGISVNDEILTKISDDKINNLILIGAINNDKCQLEAVKAMDFIINDLSIKNINLIMVGGIINKKYHNQIVEYINKKNINKYIFFAGYLDDVSQYRDSNYIALICSSGEAFGRVTIEALANKQLLIGANKGATSEIIQDKVDGFLYESGNYISLANTIVDVIALKNESKNFIKINGYKKVKENYSIEITADRLYKIFQNIIYQDNIH